MNCASALGSMSRRTLLSLMSIGMFNWGVAHFRDLVQVNREGGFRDLWTSCKATPSAF